MTARYGQIVQVPNTYYTIAVESLAGLDHRCPKNHHQLVGILARHYSVYVQLRQGQGDNRALSGMVPGRSKSGLGWKPMWKRMAATNEKADREHQSWHGGTTRPFPVPPVASNKHGHGTSGYRSIDIFFLKEHVPCLRAWCFAFSHSRLVPVRKFSQVPSSWLLAPGPGKLEAPSHTNPADMTCV